MKSSFYNYYFLYNNKHYVYNILSTAIIELDEEVDYALKNNNISNIPEDYLDDLLEMNFIISKNCDETSLYRYYYDTTRFTYTAGEFRLMFIPTYNCNLRCPYCYEGQHKASSKITMESTNKIIMFLKNQIKNSYIPIDRIVISLFGGEPTLCYDEMQYFIESVNNLANDYKIEIVYDITTNFTIVTDQFLDLIKTYRINTQVTIDGTKIQHDSRRITASGRGTYDLIIHNLERSLDKGLKDHITIRINTDEDNVLDYEEVFRQMLKYSDDVYFGIINKYAGRNDGYSKKCLEENVITNLFSDKLSILYKSCGLQIPIKFGKKNPCSLNSINKFMIDNNLNVYKCDLLLNLEEYKVGHINENGEFIRNENYYKQMSYSPFNFDECKNCKLLPLCGSNCPGERILKEKYLGGEIKRGYCLMNFEKLEQYLKSYIKMVE